MTLVSSPVVRSGVACSGFVQEQVSGFQRARMLATMIDVVSELGVNGVTVAHVVARSGVSRRTFYALFEDREDCFLAAFDQSVERIAAAVVPAYEGGGAEQRSADWPGRIRAGVRALLEFLDAEPGIGRLVVVESLGAGPRALERRACMSGRLIAAVDEGRKEEKATRGLSLLTAEGVVGGALAVIHARLQAPRPGSLTDLANQLTSMIVLPYLGRGAARRELERRAPQAREIRAARGEPDAFRDLHIRFTYRTARVLSAIAQSPGACNREVAERSGVEDQGQISKLLTRLQRHGLIQNTGGGWGRGEPNAWQLSTRGQQVTQTIRAHAGENREVA